MKSNNDIISLLGLGILLMLITIVNTPIQLFSQNTVNASTQEEDDGQKDSPSGSADDTDTTSEPSGTTQVRAQQSDNATTNDETLVLQDQDQVQQPQQSDTISPKILSVTPNIGTSGIPVTTKVTATFSEPVDVSTLDSKTFTLKTDGNEVKGTTSLSSDGTTATFTPSSSLSGSTIYTASISEVKDLAGNTMDYASPWSFTTEAQAAPTPQTPPSNPGNGGSGNSGSNSGGEGIFGDIKISPSESGVLKDAAQYVEDEKLVDRILPIILSKMDKRQLAATVLPYLDLQVTVRQVQGESKSAQGDTTANFLSSSSCSPEEILIGGAFGSGGATKILSSSMNGNQWQVSSIHNPYYSHVGVDQSVTTSYAICMTINLVPKDPNSPTLTNGGP